MAESQYEGSGKGPPAKYRGVVAGMRPVILPLTSIRFFAAFAVIIFHYDRKFEIFPNGLSNFGYEAVTFFFILSGFILTYTHGRQDGLNVSNRKFGVSRLARIAPAYFLALIVALPVKNASSEMILVVPMLQAWWPPAALLWNAPAWSLSNEMFFYAMYPAIWWAMSRLPQLAVLFLASALVDLAALFRATDGISPHFASYFPLLNLPQFILGAALGKQFIERGRLAYSNALFAATALSLGFTIVYRPSAVLDGGALCLIFGAMVYSLAGVDGKVKAALSFPPLVVLGEAAYAIYILHWPLGQWWDRVLRVNAGIVLPSYLDFILYCIFAIATAILVMIAFETPARRWISALSQ
jgi:peptidoglycan/LPS O-acetylase OafA/YrhL